MTRHERRRAAKVSKKAAPAAPKPQLSLVESDEARWARFGVTGPAELLHDFAAKQKERGNSAIAIVALRRAISMCPESGFLWCALGAMLWDTGDLDGAVAALQTAQEFGCDGSILHWNIGLVLGALKRYGEAEANYNTAIRLDPKNLAAQWNKALMYLDSGDWKRGFDEYEIRKTYLGPEKYPNLPYPMWEGQDLNDKTIYIQAEQGVGDRILLSRYLAWLRGAYPDANILFCPGDELLALFSGLANELNIRLVYNNEPAPKNWIYDRESGPTPIDYGCFLASLPKFHGSTPDNVPEDSGAIRRLADKLSFKLVEPRVPAIKVGFCWTGNPTMLRNRERSIPLPMMLELEDNPKVQLFNLQFGPPRQELYDLGAGDLISDVAAGVANRGYIGTAAATLQMDLVVTVCTSVAHLAGALGVPCWVLLCHNPYWVWLREGERSVWYPSVKLFRQDSPGDWGPVIDRVKLELDEHAERVLSSRQSQAA